MAWLPLDFCDGEIELWVASELVPEAPAYHRGFIGVSFRINEEGQFESIYLRPTNSQSDDQVRRNHSVQYVAFPEYRFDRLRLESPEKYETYAELELACWMHMRVDIGVSLDIENYCTLRLFFDLSTLAGLSRRNLPEAGIRLLFQI